MALTHTQNTINLNCQFEKLGAGGILPRGQSSAVIRDCTFINVSSGAANDGISIAPGSHAVLIGNQFLLKNDP